VLAALSRVSPRARARVTPTVADSAMRLERLAVAWAPFCLTLLAVRNRRVSQWESGVSQRVNRLPDWLHPPVWSVMQLGALAAPPVLAGVAVVAGRPALGRRLATSGLTAYVLAKGVKRVVRRGRPLEFLPGVTVRGRPASGDGFVSGHAAVSMALAVEAYDEFGPSARALPLLGASVVGLARIYVGAHLPLDAIGGAALGWAVATTLHPHGDRRRRR
jgi:membrane-associated phospholipid phosphatase